eukprot:358192-Chlamydomonas_euryale.AAC.18
MFLEFDLRNTGQAGSQSSQPEDNSASTRKRGYAVRDPVHMFGVLVPPALKDCQQSFRRVIDIVEWKAVYSNPDLYASMCHACSFGAVGAVGKRKPTHQARLTKS